MSGIRTNSDGSVDLIAGAKLLSLKTTGEVVKEQQRVTFPIVSGEALVPVPAWATKMTITGRGLTGSPSGIPFLRGIEATGQITTGYTASVIIAGPSSATAGTLQTTIIPITAGQNTESTSFTWEFIKMGSVWFGKGTALRSDGVAYTGYADFPVAVALTGMKVSHNTGAILTGTYNAVFE